jgi:hypothetical protein
VGRPFSISTSVKEQCAPTSQVPDRCDNLYEFLREFANEQREVQWASSMERRLEKSIVENDPPIYRVRALECRTTRCAVEVWAPGEAWNGMLDNDPALSRELWGTTAKLGFETDSQGNRIVVTIVGFQLR